MSGEEKAAEVEARHAAGELTDAEREAALWRIALEEHAAKPPPVDLFDRIGAAVAAGLRAFVIYEPKG